MRAIQRQFVASFLLIASALLPATASAASDVLLKFGAIKGDANVQGYPDRIAIDAFNWGLSRSVDLFGSKGGGDIGLPFSSDVTLVKLLDGASSELAAEFLIGTPRDAVISVIAVGGDKTAVELVRLELCDAVISSVSSAVSSGGNLEEHLSVSFRAFRLVYTEVDPKTGSPSPQSPVRWDFMTNTVSNCSVPG